MEMFRAVVKVLAVGSLLIGALQIYLILNKLWKRKHEPVVAESISIMGETIGLLPLVFLTAAFALDGQWEGVVDGAMWIVAGSVTIVIGTGRWVEGKRGRGFWELLLGSVGREREEVADLALSLFRPSAAGKILDILRRLAWIDRELDERERAFIARFAASWGIDLEPGELEAGGEEGAGGFVELRRALAGYLATSPPSAQVRQLGDVIQALVRADASVSDREALILEEMEGLLGAYLSEEGSGDGDGAASGPLPRHVVAIVPQDEDQNRAVRELIPDAREEHLLGGRAYVVGRHFSEGYAEVVGDRYRALGFFTAVVSAGSRGMAEAGGTAEPPETPPPVDRGPAGGHGSADGSPPADGFPPAAPQ